MYRQPGYHQHQTLWSDRRLSVFRWGLVIAGVIMVWLSISSWIDLQPIDEEPKTLTIQQACELVQGKDQAYISIKAPVDNTRRLFRTGIKAPAFAAYPSSEPQTITPEQANKPRAFNRLLGCTVEIKSKLTPPGLIIEVAREETDPSADQVTKKVVYHRVLAAVEGSHGRLFVLSERFLPTEDQKIKQWLRSTRLDGRLSLLNEMPTNLPEAQNKLGWIRSEFAKAGLAIPREAAVILTDRSFTRPPEGPEGNTYYAPIAGSQNTLFVEAASEQPLPNDGVVTGIFKPSDGRKFRGFSSVLGQPMPVRLGIITLLTAAEYNRAAYIKSLSNAGIGLGLTSLGALLIQHKRKKKQHIVAEQQACAAVIQEEVVKPPPKPKSTLDDETEGSLTIIRQLRSGH